MKRKRAIQIQRICITIIALGFFVIFGIVGGVDNNTLPLSASLWCIPLEGLIFGAGALATWIDERL